MKYVVYWRSKPESCYIEEICANEEDLASTIQLMQVDPQTMCPREAIDIKVFPYFKVGQMVLNIKTLQTRIVKSVHAFKDEGKLIVYNHDCPDEVKLQKCGIIPVIPEEWDMHDCIPVDSSVAHAEYDFQFGTQMGTHPQYSRMKVTQMSMW